MSLDKDCWSKVVSFLNRKEAGRLCCVSKQMRNDVEADKYTIQTETVYSLEYPGGWFATEHVLTKPNALKRVDVLKENPKTTLVWLMQCYADIGWVANRPTFSQRWERKLGGEWRLVLEAEWRSI